MNHTVDGEKKKKRFRLTHSDTLIISLVYNPTTKANFEFSHSLCLAKISRKPYLSPSHLLRIWRHTGPLNKAGADLCTPDKTSWLKDLWHLHD